MFLSYISGFRVFGAVSVRLMRALVNLQPSRALPQMTSARYHGRRLLRTPDAFGRGKESPDIIQLLSSAADSSNPRRRSGRACLTTPTSERRLAMRRAKRHASVAKWKRSNATRSTSTFGGLCVQPSFLPGPVSRPRIRSCCASRPTRLRPVAVQCESGHEESHGLPAARGTKGRTRSLPLNSGKLGGRVNMTFYVSSDEGKSWEKPGPIKVEGVSGTAPLGLPRAHRDRASLCPHP